MFVSHQVCTILLDGLFFKELKTLAMLVLKLFVCDTFPGDNIPNLCILVHSRVTAKVILKILSVLETYASNFLCHMSHNVVQLLNNAKVVFRSDSLKMMNLHGFQIYLMLKVSDQNHSISECHDVGAKNFE